MPANPTTTALETARGIRQDIEELTPPMAVYLDRAIVAAILRAQAEALGEFRKRLELGLEGDDFLSAAMLTLIDADAAAYRASAEEMTP